MWRLSNMTEKVRVLQVGCGGIAGAWIEACQRMRDVEIVGLVDIREENARTTAAKYGLGDMAVSCDLAGAIEQLRPAVVFDCTVPEAHVDVTLTALSHGCHVLGEKPLADSMENARRMVKAAEDSGRLYAVMQNRRYDANIRRLRSFLDTGRIGNLTTVASDFFIAAHFSGFRAEMKHVLLLDMAIHTFDAARFISRADPVSVYCHEWTPPNSWFRNDPAAVAVFEMSNGIVYDYRGSWVAEGLHTTWESDWRVIGGEGSVRWNGGEYFAAQVAVEGTQLIRDHADVPVPAGVSGEDSSGHYGCVREFIDCVKNGSIPETICTDNIRSLAMVFAAIKSATEGRRVEVSY
jgi:predicted dehydrogenase